MFSTLRTRFGIPGVISVIALVFAMLGGAYAASNSSGGGKATASAKAKKGLRRQGDRPGRSRGPQGPAGASGHDGANGQDGFEGEPGQDGANGKSVKVAEEATGTGNCEGRGGASIQVEGSAASTKYACNGKEGATGPAGAVGPAGPEGVCSTAGCTLPKGVTLRGVWSSGRFVATAAAEQTFVPISLTVPVSGSVPNLVYLKKGENEDASGLCKGGPSAPEVLPSASGSTIICIFATEELNWTVPVVAGNAIANKLTVGASNARRAGGVFEGQATAAGPTFAYGVWAVRTAP